MVEDPLEGIVVNAYRNTFTFEIREEEKYCPYYGQAFALCSVVSLFRVCKGAGPVINQFRCLARLFLLEDAANLDFACICV